MRRKAEREQSESPRQRAARLKKEADELRERDEILDDAERVFAFTFVSRETRRWPAGDRRRSHAAAEGDREDQRGTADEALRRPAVGRRERLPAGARPAARDRQRLGRLGRGRKVERGSGFDFVRKKVAGAWVASRPDDRGLGQHAPLPLVRDQDRHDLRESPSVRDGTANEAVRSDLVNPRSPSKSFHRGERRGRRAPMVSFSATSANSAVKGSWTHSTYFHAAAVSAANAPNDRGAWPSSFVSRAIASGVAFRPLSWKKAYMCLKS